mmetsp:Transcript_12351/g.26062  ORF Transcript_12351/g.26062 Transcript_12351/m.26062 type:complete len:233 (+) Transcript_12351:763-1461(+)
MRDFPPEFGQHHPGFLSVRELGHFSDLHGTADAKAAQILALFVAGITGIERFEELERGLLQVQDVDKVLGEAAEFQVPVGTNVSHGRIEFAGHELDECGLSRPVRSDQRHARIQIDPKINVSIERLASRIPKGHVVKGQHGWRQVARIGELEVEQLFFLRFGGETGPDHFLQYLFLGLCLLGVLGGTVAEAGNVFLHLLDGILFPLVLFPLVFFLFGFGLDELVVVSVVVDQ